MGAHETEKVETRITGTGHSEYLWSAAIVSSLLYAVVYLLEPEVTTKPVIQTLSNDEGFNAYLVDGQTTVSIRTFPKKRTFTMCVHSSDHFSPECVSLLAVGILDATIITRKSSDDHEMNTHKMKIKVDSSQNWNLVEEKYEIDPGVEYSTKSTSV